MFCTVAVEQRTPHANSVIALLLFKPFNAVIYTIAWRVGARRLFWIISLRWGKIAFIFAREFVLSCRMKLNFCCGSNAVIMRNLICV